MKVFWTKAKQEMPATTEVLLFNSPHAACMFGYLYVAKVQGPLTSNHQHSCFHCRIKELHEATALA